MARVRQEAAELLKVVPENFQVSSPPEFNIGKARKAIKFVDSAFQITDLPALRLALILSSYNRSGVKPESDDPNYFLFSGKYTALVDAELRASDPSNMLPTIGIEVESPRKLFDEDRDSIQYAIFFDSLTGIGMPRNRVNSSSSMDNFRTAGNTALFWEFSPPPSYSAAVQARIISELIKGRFIPSLKFSRKPEDIRELLDDKLVSMHINIGVPTWAGEMTPLDEEGTLLGQMFALAFTSATRLHKRMQSEFIGLKSNSEATCKSLPPDSKEDRKRIEFKACEVRDESCYRQLYEMQLLSCAYLSNRFSKDPAVSRVWSDLAVNAKEVMDKFNVQKIIFSKDKVAILVEKTDIGKRLRKLITPASQRVKYLLDQP